MHALCCTSFLPADCSASESIKDPICVLAPNATKAVEYDNPCLAKKAGVDFKKGYTYYR